MSDTSQYTQAELDWFAQFAAMTPEQQAQVRAEEDARRTTPPNIAAPTATPGPDTTAADNRMAFNLLASYLSDAGLGGLFSINADGTPSGWLWDQITSGLDSADALQIALEATPQFKGRYPVIDQMRKRAAAGEPVMVPSVAEVREYEQTVTRIMRAAGLPPWFYDNFDDAQRLMTEGISAAEVEQRLGSSWERVQNTDPAVRQAFSEFYGISGDAALAAFYLDKGQTVSKLEQVSRAAYTAGQGTRIGLDLDKQVAERIAALPLSDTAIHTALTEVGTLAGSGVFTEGITETADMTAENEGVGVTFFGDGGARARIERRTLARSANERSSTGGAALTQGGLAVRNV